MNVVSWVVVAVFSLLPVLVTIRWVRNKRRTSYPSIVNEWTGALEPNPKQEEWGPVETEETQPVRAPLPFSSEILAHCRTLFAVEGELVQDDHLTVPIAIFPPTRKRGWWTYATAGLHAEGHTELVLYSYKREEAMIAHLAEVVKKVRERFAAEGKGVKEYDLFPLPEPVTLGSPLDHLLVVPPFFEEEAFACYYNGEDVIHFLMLLPVTEAEYRYLTSHGWDALVERFVRQKVNALDFLRQSVVDGGVR
jgi:hypothetical protein